MVQCLTYAPQCQFFERVPLGRIINRFTKDQSVLDTEIYWWVAWLYLQVFNLLGNTFLNVYTSSIYILIPVVGFMGVAWSMQRIYMKATRELYRLESISKSPILSYFSETIIGLSVVRAFGKE
jgi:ABC-type multidrug transport system fused ATPase/permease subunit